MRPLAALFICLLLLARTSFAGGVVEIADPTGYRQVLAISDVHGMLRSLVRLLKGAGVIDSEKSWSAGATLLVVVGDSIDKGPDSLDVLDLWMRLEREAASAGGRLVVLLGNHEAEFLASPYDDKKAAALYEELKRKKVHLRELIDPAFPRAAFLRSLPVAARVGRWLFAHAGLYSELSWSEFVARAERVLAAGEYDDAFLSDEDSILEAKDWWDDERTRSRLEGRLEKNGLYGVVFGHQPGAFGAKGKIASTDGGLLIKIDSGMAPESGSNKGHLLQFAVPAEMLVARPARVFSIGESGARHRVEEVSPKARAQF